MSESGKVLEEFLSLVGDFKQYVINSSSSCLDTTVFPGKDNLTSSQTSVAKIGSLTRERKVADLKNLRDEIGDCTGCGLHKGRRNLVFGTGSVEARLMFVGEAPGGDEDRKGEPFVGRAGQLLNDIIRKGIGLEREDVYIANIVKCRPPENRNPMPDEIEACLPYLLQQIDIIQPEVICTLGLFAAQQLLKLKFPISELRGKVFDCNGTKIIPTYHPAYLLRNAGKKRETWEDVQLLLRELKLPVPGKGGSA